MSDQSVLMLLVQQLQSELQNQRSEVQSLRTEVNVARSEIQQLHIQLSSKSAPRTRLPDPPRFDGKPYTLRTWLPSIRAKLRSDQLAGSDAFDYVWDRLEQPQQASVLHLRHSAEDTQSWDPEVIFLFFQRLCHNPREQQEAIQRFSSVRQREDESLVAYLARFERLSYEADSTTWPDTSRISTLHRGLRSTLRQTLEETNDSLFNLTYDQYIELVQRIDRRVRRPQFLASAQKPPPRSALPRAEPRTESHTEPMDIGATQIAVLRPDSPTPSMSSGSSSFFESSEERLTFRRKHSLCLYCGSDNHWISSCPKSRPRPRPTSLTDMTASPTPSNIPRTKTTAKSATLSALTTSYDNPL
jgi:hypothetical protein